MGSATDLKNAGLRRLIVNAACWALGMESSISATSSVDIVGTYEPLESGFNYDELGVKPQPFVLSMNSPDTRKSQMLNRILLTMFAILFAVPAPASDLPAQLPKSDGSPADHSKPVLVYIMMGQSNMLGFGRVGPKETKGTLEYFSKKMEIHSFIDDSGNWITRQDVRYVHVMDPRGVDYNDMETFSDVRNEADSQ